jgi:hypothetical protein
MSTEEHVRDQRSARAPNLGSTPGPRAPIAESLVVRLQRTLGNRAVGRLLESHRAAHRPAVVQRQDDEEVEGAVGGHQAQVLASAKVPDYEPEAAALERAATAAAGRLEALIEDERSAETRGQRLTIDALRQALVTTFGQIRTRAREISAAIQGQPGGQPAAARSLAVINNIDLAFSAQHEAFRPRLAANIHRAELTALGSASSASEVSAVDRRSNRREPSVTQADIREIQNWVGGGWSTMNRFMFGAEKAEDREARQMVLDQPLPADPHARALVEKNQWEMNLQARVSGLEAALAKLPRYTGTTYRQATPRDMSVYGGAIKVGDFIQSPGFFATSPAPAAATWARTSRTWPRSAKSCIRRTPYSR